MSLNAAKMSVLAVLLAATACHSTAGGSATGSGGSGTGTGTGTGSGSGSSDAGTGTGSGTDAGTGTGSGTDAGTGTGSGTDAGTGSGSSADAGTGSTTPTMTALAVAPASVSLPKGAQEQLTATATWSNGSTSDVTALAAWSTSNVAVAEALVSGGLQWAMAAGEGAATVSATLSGQTASTSITVTSPALASLQISPAVASIAAGTQQQFSLVGLYSDGTRADLTASATWSVSGSSASAGTAGLVSGAAMGAATVTAASGSLSATASLTVTAATLTSIGVSPADASIAAGTEQQLAATGVFSDYTVQDLTAQVTWSSSPASVASVSASGLVSAASTGTAIVSAALSGISGSTALIVTTATLTGIEVSPVSATLAAGTSTPLSVAGLFSDLTVQDMTASASWTSSAPAIAIVDGPNAVGVAAGSAILTASVGGFTASTSVSVTAAALAALSISGASGTLQKGLNRQLSASGTFSDGSTQDLTAQIVWSSSDGAVVTVSNAPGSEGMVHAQGAGTATVFANLLGISASAAMTVDAVSVTSVTISPANPMLPVGFSSHLYATAQYSDGSTHDVTAQAVWSSSNTAVATVSNAAGSQGQDTGLASGTATVSAHFGGVQGSATLTVFSGKISSIAITPATLTLAKGSSQRVVATGTWANGFSMDVTAQVRWSSSNRGVAVANNSARGLVSAAGSGSATVTAFKTGKSGTLAVTVQ